MMSRKKANSQSSVPFSWEKMPGVPKSMISPASPLVKGVNGLRNNNEVKNNGNLVERKILLPPPPGHFQVPAVGRSSSNRIYWKEEEEDPFLVALRECTKDCDKMNCKAKGDIKKSFGYKAWRSKSFLSCKRSCDVEEHNLGMRPLSCGPNRRKRIQSLIQMQEQVQGLKNK